MRYHEVALEVSVESPPAEGPQRRHAAPTLARLVGARVRSRSRARARARARVRARVRIRVRIRANPTLPAVAYLRAR